MPRSVFGEDPEADKRRLLLSYFVTIRLGALLGGGDHERDPGIPAVGPVAVAQGMIAFYGTYTIRYRLRLMSFVGG
jgi:hypothetical protein